MKRIHSVVFMPALIAAFTFYSIVGLATPVLQLRLRAPDSASDSAWASTAAIIAENPGCCDEVWFSTGIGVPPIAVHADRAKRIIRAAAELRARGISPSLQFQATLGHGDNASLSEDCSAKTWTGWTGSTGVEAKACNCPRQPGFLAYVRAVSRLYAAFKPVSVWIDDDLRLDNHRPATAGSRPGCWCARCIADFNAASGGSWTRQTLDAAMAKDKSLAAKWRSFSNGSVAAVARAIAEEFHAISPETFFALQHGTWAADTIRAVLETLRDVGGKPVGMRPGGGDYYDSDPNAQIRKSLVAARFRRTFGDPDWISVWTPEIESWPRVYGSRSAQSILVEGFAGLMYGMNAISMLVTHTGNELPALYSRTILRPLADGAPVLRGYAAANVGTLPAGFTSGLPVSRLYSYALCGVPVLFGPGRSCGELTEKDVAVSRFTTPSDGIQAMRDALDARASGTPAVVMSPFVGLIMPRVVAKNGALRTVALLNTRIDAQGPIELRLRGVPPRAEKAIWYELRRAPLNVPLRRGEDGCVYAKIPEIGAWNGGYLDFGLYAED